MQKHFLDYEFPLFVFLTRFVGLGIGPTDECLTAFAKNVANGMEAGDQKAILAGSGGDVDALIEKVGPPCCHNVKNWECKVVFSVRYVAQSVRIQGVKKTKRELQKCMQISTGALATAPKTNASITSPLHYIQQKLY